VRQAGVLACLSVHEVSALLGCTASSRSNPAPRHFSRSPCSRRSAIHERDASLAYNIANCIRTVYYCAHRPDPRHLVSGSSEPLAKSSRRSVSAGTRSRIVTFEVLPSSIVRRSSKPVLLFFTGLLARRLRCYSLSTRRSQLDVHYQRASILRNTPSESLRNRPSRGGTSSSFGSLELFVRR
jgi:hypothetical protein